MTISPDEFRVLRLGLEFTQERFGRALGMSGKPNTIKQQVSDLERGVENITLKTWRLARMYALHGVPEEFEI